MGKTLYLECYSGISGDMTVAALLDLGADRSVLDRVLKSLKVSGFETKISRVVKSGIDACDFDVVLDKEHENHDHDMEYLYGHHHEGHERNHAHGTGTAQDHHHHEHRGIKEITYIIEHSAMTENAKKIALRIFEILAEAESKAHNVPVDQVHFHEVGAVDSIVDIVSVAVCLDNLDVTEVIVPVLCEGRGTVRCQHGILPIPVPAVANIVSANHLYLKMTEVEGELVTPTGAAIVAAVKTKDKLPETFEIQKIGIGAGKRQYECPGILRAMFISESTEQAKGRNPKAENQETKDTIIKMETNIDDCSGEVLGFVMERLMKAGARDVHYVPVFMKKNRPAWVLNVICKEEDMETLQNIIFEETTTIGIRYSIMERTILPRETRTLPTPWGEVQVKVCTLNGKEQIYPASMTKIMTAVVGLENLSDQNETITIDRDTYDRLYTEGASLAGFGVGDEVKAIDILYGVMLPSGAECCVGLAQHLFGSEENFVAKMNEKAAELGMDSTHFVTCTGLHDENHYTTVYDIYLMLQEAMTYPHFLEIAQLSSYNLTCNRGEQEVTFHLDATDQYLTRQVTAPKNVTVLGGKTGTTSDAGSCLALLSQNAYGEPYISIVLHAANKTNLYAYMNELLSAINQ